MTFRGTFDYSLDAKNRLTVPAKFRAALSEGVVLAKTLEPCIALWTPTAFDDNVAATLNNFPPGSAEHTKWKRFFSANAFDCDLDAAGRVMVPAFLLEHANLKKEVVVTGAGDSLEIWDRSTWADYNAGLVDDITAITQSLGNTA